MDTKQKTNAIKYIFRRSPIQVSDNSIEALARLAQEADFLKQTTILDIVEKQSYIYLILQGMARSFYIEAEALADLHNYSLAFINEQLNQLVL